MVRYLAAAAAAAGILMLAGTAMAAPVTYYVYSTKYVSANAATGVCPAGDCSAAYTTNHRVVGYFTIVAPPLPNETGYDISMGINQFSISDGQKTYTDADRDITVFINTAKVDTNASGEIVGFEFKFDRAHTPGSFPTGDPNDPAARVSSIWFTSNGALQVLVDSNAICQARGDNATDGASATGGTYGAGCLLALGSNADGASGATAASVTVSLTPPPPEPVPTLSEWAMILLGALLAGGAALNLHRRRQTA